MEKGTHEERMRGSGKSKGEIEDVRKWEKMNG